MELVALRLGETRSAAGVVERAGPVLLVALDGGVSEVELAARNLVFSIQSTHLGAVDLLVWLEDR